MKGKVVRIVEALFIKKMIDRCLIEYFGDLELSPFTNEDYDVLVEEIGTKIEQQQEEPTYVVVHDQVYQYLATQQ
ncbi:YqzH family protein [Pseudalkalibacillus berkeleyi]|uniref:YqzH-like protein n=1 Tax=Pseudalkalibacillus berkeleyi TaxID=1069813 RepID=A0ABS9H184_9BACL|nr:YqzH family protein [Pseudalkalibacillus berkeleyi]MCF6137786.1 hypothetical protein [Pseudalkalibacillus berkeleyi]